MPVRKSAKKTSARKQSPTRSLYGPAIRDAIRHGDATEMKALAVKAGNNPYCHHRTRELSKRGLRERLAQTEKAPGVPFDHGRFDLIQEQLDGTTISVNDAPRVERPAGSTISPNLPSGTKLVQIASARNRGKNMPASGFQSQDRET